VAHPRHLGEGTEIGYGVHLGETTVTRYRVARFAVKLGVGWLRTGDFAQAVGKVETTFPNAASSSAASVPAASTYPVRLGLDYD
jgi:hypothetical protein